MTDKAAPAPDDGKVKATATRKAKGSVQEAIGKLIGDDSARDQGKAKKNAATQSSDSRPEPKRP